MGELTSLSIPDSKEALESSFRREEWLVIVLSSSLVLSLVSNEAACIGGCLHLGTVVSLVPSQD